MLLEQYDDTYVEFMWALKLEGVEFKADSGCMYDELKPLVIDSPRWTYIKPFGPTQDVRGSVLALKKQAEGSAATNQRKKVAYNAIIE